MISGLTIKIVPNVPCGVESIVSQFCKFSLFLVPNVPCGVERKHSSYKRGCNNPMFLMYRVELKGYQCNHLRTNRVMFLMYRVELKDRHKT